MATNFMIALEELLGKTGANVDFLREAERVQAEALMELEVFEQIGSHRHERTSDRVTYRNGCRTR